MIINRRGGADRDTAQFVGRTLFLHTPDGFGRSELATLLGRADGPLSPRGAGTARNWATVTKLLSMCDPPGDRLPLTQNYANESIEQWR